MGIRIRTKNPKTLGRRPEFVSRMVLKGRVDSKIELKEVIKELKNYMKVLPKYPSTHKIVKND